MPLTHRIRYRTIFLTWNSQKATKAISCTVTIASMDQQESTEIAEKLAGRIFFTTFVLQFKIHLIKLPHLIRLIHEFY